VCERLGRGAKGAAVDAGFPEGPKAVLGERIRFPKGRMVSGDRDARFPGWAAEMGGADEAVSLMTSLSGGGRGVTARWDRQRETLKGRFLNHCLPP
jgi:hypothetical protein